ncbi:hypothetical protein [uncultured Jatrophihabitans sp.]|uniref:hypothetical protein n=1 Tax=uncultured Jatrophihabitans sp. TaxID=1610747 RepID=UPI0035C9A2D7
MPPIDELLRGEGERWRAEVDARGERDARASSRAADPRLTRRRVLGWSASLAGAAATVTLLGALIAHGGTSEGGSSSASRADAGGAGSAAASTVAAAPSCAGPSLRIVDPRAAVPKVARGQVLVVQGTGYVGDCIDTVTTGALPTSPPLRAVDVRLSTADLRTVLVARARPSSSKASFTVRVRVPVDAAVGPAVLTDGRGHKARLTIVAR